MKRVPAETHGGKRVIKRYLGNLKGSERTARALEIAERRDKAKRGDYDYSPLKTDKGIKTKPSKYTMAYRKRYGSKK